MQNGHPGVAPDGRVETRAARGGEEGVTGRCQ